MTKRDLDCTTSQIKTKSYFHLRRRIDCRSSMQQMSPSFSFTFSSFPLLPLTPLLLPLSEQFQTWEISRSQLRGVAGWNQFHRMADREHVPTQHFRSMPMKRPRGTSANLWCSLEGSIAFRLDLIRASLSWSKLIPAWKVTRKHQCLISTLQYVCTFLM